jgi:hypothetical protein
MFVRKICTYNVDEIDFRGQFHQHVFAAFLLEQDKEHFLAYGVWGTAN